MENNSRSNTNRLVSNSFFLTARMLLLMVISFYTSRVVLDKLGFVDYGIYNVVGGLTTLFVFFRSSLSNVTQRYLNIELGRGNVEGARRVFRQHHTLYIIISAVVVILLETIGLWFLYHKLVIPEERMNAAFWVFQFMIFSLVLTLLSVVFNSSIVAHEDFKIYAYISLFEGVGKLAIAFLIGLAYFDRLIFFAFLHFFISLLIRIYYRFFCRKHYEECTFRFDFNTQAFKEAFGMIGWNTVGTAVHAINNQGMDVLLNLYFGPVINAAKGIATSVGNYVMVFTNSFYTSVRPQLTKSYASNDTEQLLRLFYTSSKYGFFILWIVCLPTMLCVNELLAIWLKDVPDHAGSFAVLAILFSLVNVLNDPIWSLSLSVGKLKWYIIIGSGVFLMAFPISYIFLRLGYAPESVFVVNAVVRAVYIVVVLFIIKRYVPISIRQYLIKVIIPIAIVVVISGGLSVAFDTALPEFPVRWIAIGGLCAVFAAASIWIVGLKRNERQFFMKRISDKFFNKK